MRAKLTIEEVANKMRKWCAYQERSQQAARIKCRSFFVAADDAEAVVALLIGEGFLNEERFATAYAGGKFRMKGWGKLLIQAGLRRHRVPDALIKSALETIDGSEYRNAALSIIRKKLGNGKLTASAYSTVTRSIIAKGYESSLIAELLRELHGNLQFEVMDIQDES